MRQMRMSKREITDTVILNEILEECDVVRIGVSDKEGMFIVPVNFGYEFTDNTKKELILYIHGAKAGRKSDAFAKKPNVAIEMDCRHQLINGEYSCNYSYAYRSIMGNGKIHELTEKEAKITALTRILNHTAPDAKINFLADTLDRIAVYQIDVEYFTGKERPLSN